MRILISVFTLFLGLSAHGSGKNLQGAQWFSNDLLKVWAPPPISDTLLGASATQTVSNKSIDADNNTITDIDNNEIKAAAGIVYSKLNLTGSIVSSDISASAQIPYSKLNLSNSIVNADVNTSAAIAYSKLNLSGAIVSSDISASAQIPYSKLADLTASRLLVSNASGDVSVSSVTSTESGYLSGTTSAIQTQIDNKVSRSFGLINDTLSFTDQGSDVAAPSAGFKNLYSKSGGMFYRNSGATIYQISNLEEAQTFTGSKTFQNVSMTTTALNLQVGQIAFPSTQNASASANTLDDYEEGTFSPTIRGTGTAGTGTYSAQIGFYTKIGNVVHFWIYINWTNLTGQTGSLAVGSLPFTSNATANYFQSVTIGQANNVALTASNVMQCYIAPSNSFISVTQSPVGGGAATSVAVDTSGELIISGSYII